MGLWNSVLGDTKKCYTRAHPRTGGIPTQTIFQSLTYIMKKIYFIPPQDFSEPPIWECVFGRGEREKIKKWKESALEHPRRKHSQEYFPRCLTVEAFSSDITTNISCKGVPWNLGKMQISYSQMKKTVLRKAQSRAKGHNASRSVHSLSKNPGPLTPYPVLPESASHYNAKRIWNRCLLVNALSQGKVILKRKLKTFLYNLQAAQNLIWLWLQKSTLKLPSGTPLMLLIFKNPLQPTQSAATSPCGRRKISNSYTYVGQHKIGIVQTSG